MKISPVTSAGSTIGSISMEQSQAGQAPSAPHLRSIKMNVNRTPDGGGLPLPDAPAATEAQTPETTATETSEVTQPLSREMVAIAKQRRALQVKERELAAKEKALADTNAKGIDLERLKTAPIKTLLDAGITYEQLTQDVLANQDAYNPRITELERKLTETEQRIQKSLSDREAQQEQQALSEMRREATILSATGEDYALVRETRSVGDVVKLIERTYRETGEVLDVSEALSLVENELVKESLQRAKVSKVMSQLSPAQASPQAQSAPRMRTLTNRDNATAVLDRRARAIAAMTGTLKK